MNLKIITIKIISLALIFSQTDNQISKAKEIIKKTGMSEAEVINAAKAQGYSERQINDVINREKAKLKNKQENNISIEDQQNVFQDNTNSSNNLYEDQQIENEDIEIVPDENDAEQEKNSFESEIQPQIPKVQYFGYDIFRQDPDLFQSSSVGMVDPDYLVGPGDEIIVMLWGETQFRQVFKVNREGFVFIPEIGQVFVNGLTLNLLESKLFKVLGKYYSSLNNQGSRTATTFLDVSLGNLRPLRIQVLGEVAQPGAYTVSPAATLFSALYYFNGPTTLGSLREIRLIRNGKEISSIDFYDYLLSGKKPKDEKLQLDDIIFIPKRKKSVTIGGEVSRPAIYELKDNESLDDLISIAGGLKITAYLKRVQIDRIVPFAQRDIIGMDRMFIDIDLSNQSIQKEPFKLMDGDYVQLFSILDLRLNVVQIAGSVVRPGRYDIGDSLSLSQLVIKADSLLGDAYLDRVDIVRIKPDQTEELIKLNLGKAINGDLANDIKLKSLDKVRVYSMTEMDPQKFVSIKGNVKRSGQYRLLKNMNMYDLIFQAAGGFIDQEFKNTTYLKRAELVRYDNELNKKELITFNLEELLESGNSDIILKPNDAIRIYSLEEIEGSTKFASIKGFVKKPGSYELFEKNMTIYDLVFKAGGFEDLIYKSNTYLERADLIRFDEDRVNKRVIPFNLGELLKNKNYKNNFTLIPGDEIRIYSKKVFNEEKSITIVGSIKNPGQYIYKTEMNLTDLILESGGVVEDVSKYRVEIARVDPNSVDKDIYAESMTFEINQKYDVISGLTNQIDKNENILLFPNDYISIKPDPYYGMQKRVNVKGAVFYPGNYVILSPKETIFDVLNRAGGLRPNAFAKGAKFLRDGKLINIDLTKIMKRRSSRNNFKLIENDEIQVPESKNIVEVSGEVNAPGFYKYVRGGRVNDFIKEAGGFNQDAMKSNVFISFPNGKSRKYSRWLSNPKVLDGSVITIGKKPDEEPFNRTEYLTDLTSIFANIAQAVSMIIIAQR